MSEKTIPVWLYLATAFVAAVNIFALSAILTGERPPAVSREYVLSDGMVPQVRNDLTSSRKF
jgi:hypothetical protein